MASIAFPYGIQYTIKSQHQRPLRLDHLKSVGIQFIRVTWVDLTNIIRFRIIPIAHFERMLAAPRPSVSMIRGALGVVSITLAEGFSSTGEYLYLPDMGSLRVCPYAPGHASVMGWYEEKAAFPGVDGMPTFKVDMCPRATLQRIVDEASAIADVQFLVGFEIEFILLTSTNPITAINEHNWSASEGLYSGTLQSKVLEEIVIALQDADIEVQMYHSEAAPGQYEVVTGPLPPLQAADALVHTRETIYNIASKHELRATFAPRVYKNSCGAGLHTHISMHPTIPAPTHATLPPSPSPYLTPPEASFLSGLLSTLPALSLLILPIPASYARVVDGIWSGGTYVCWGTDVREAPVRLCNATSPRSRNFELRTVDATANPYTALAGVLGTGARGVRLTMPLDILDCGVKLDGGQGQQGRGHGGPAEMEERSPAEMGEEGRKAYGITQRMPLTWDGARFAMERSQVVKEVLGEILVEGYLSVNKLLASHYDTPKTEEEKLKLLVEGY